MMILIFHGYLKELFPKGTLEVEATSAAEAIAALEGHPGFIRGEGLMHRVTLPGFQSRDAIYSRTNQSEIHIVPALEGEGGKGGLAQIIIGAVMIVAAIYSGGTSTALWTAFESSMAMGGAMMMLGGVMQMLMPQPSINDGSQPRSNYLPANGNTIAIGTPIPLLIGKRRVYGQFLSFNIDAVNQSAMINPPDGVVNHAPAWSNSGANWNYEGGL
jgi:predicted phage tail protein